MKKICVLLLAALLLLTACSALTPSESTNSQTSLTEVPGTAGEQTPPESETPAETTQAPPRNEIIIWTFDAEAERTKALCEYYAGKPQQPVPVPEGGWTITVRTVAAEELIGRLTEGTEETPDLFFFYSDDFEVLLRAGMLSELPEDRADAVKKKTVPAAAAAASDGGALYAYPAALDNSFLLYYDKSVVSETGDLASVISQCEAAERCFYVAPETMGFPAMVFMSCGLTYEAKFQPDGRVTQVNCDYYTEKGLAAARMMQSVMLRDGFRTAESSPVLAFSPDTKDRAGAMIAASYQTAELKGILGDNYGVAALPSITDGETTVALSSFGTYIMVGAAPQYDETKRTFCHALAEYLVSAKAQAARFEDAEIIPVCSAAVSETAPEENEAASALIAQTPYTQRKIRVPDGYYKAMDGFTGKLLEGGAGMKTAKLQQLLDELSAFLMADVSKGTE